jgi:hypothetical protein
MNYFFAFNFLERGSFSSESSSGRKDSMHNKMGALSLVLKILASSTTMCKHA